MQSANVFSSRRTKRTKTVATYPTQPTPVKNITKQTKEPEQSITNQDISLTTVHTISQVNVFDLKPIQIFVCRQITRKLL